jgi:hypothetical protein
MSERGPVIVESGSRSQRELDSQVTSVASMDFITFFFIAMVAATIVLAPVFGAESRRGFLGPDQGLRPGWSPARPCWPAPRSC